MRLYGQFLVAQHMVDIIYIFLEKYKLYSALSISCGNFSPKLSQGMPSDFPIRVRYGVPFVRCEGEQSFSIIPLRCIQYHVIPNRNEIENV